MIFTAMHTHSAEQEEDLWRALCGRLHDHLGEHLMLICHPTFTSAKTVETYFIESSGCVALLGPTKVGAFRRSDIGRCLLVIGSE